MLKYLNLENNLPSIFIKKHLNNWLSLKINREKIISKEDFLYFAKNIFYLIHYDINCEIKYKDNIIKPYITPFSKKYCAGQEYCICFIEYNEFGSFKRKSELIYIWYDSPFFYLYVYREFLKFLNVDYLNKPNVIMKYRSLGEHVIW